MGSVTVMTDMIQLQVGWSDPGGTTVLSHLQGVGKVMFKHQLNVVTWESTAAGLDAWIHSCKGLHNVLLTISFSSHGD